MEVRKINPFIKEEAERFYNQDTKKYDIEKIKFYLCYLGEETKTEEEKMIDIC